MTDIKFIIILVVFPEYSTEIQKQLLLFTYNFKENKSNLAKGISIFVTYWTNLTFWTMYVFRFNMWNAHVLEKQKQMFRILVPKHSINKGLNWWPRKRHENIVFNQKISWNLTESVNWITRNWFVYSVLNSFDLSFNLLYEIPLIYTWIFINYRQFFKSILQFNWKVLFFVSVELEVMFVHGISWTIALVVSCSYSKFYSFTKQNLCKSSSNLASVSSQEFPEASWRQYQTDLGILVPSFEFKIVIFSWLVSDHFKRFRSTQPFHLIHSCLYQEHP